MKRFLSVIIAFLMIFSIISFSVNAEYTIKASKSKAIVIIPGITGSQLANQSSQIVWLGVPSRMEQLVCNTSGSSINNIVVNNDDNFGVLDTYQNLFEELEETYSSTYDVIFFPYDWRMSCATAATKLQTKLQNYSSVILVAHSMGGLVASKYLANSQANRTKVDKFISIGTPFTGSVKCLHVMETGDYNFWLSLLGYEDNLKSMVCNFPANYELLPTDRYSGTYIMSNSSNLSGHTAHWDFMKGQSWGKISSSTVKPMFQTATSFHSSLLVGGTHIANSSQVETYKIYGTGEDTISKINYVNRVVDSVITTNNGDGTVTTSSATNTQGTSATRVYGFTYSHLQLAKKTNVITKVKNIIDGQLSKSLLPNEISSNNINEKGWLVGENNKRINIVVHNSNIVLYNENGKQVMCDENNNLYITDNSNKSVKIGTLIRLGNNSWQYVVYDGTYSASVCNESYSPSADIRIEYMDSGYYQKIISLDSFSSDCSFSINKFDSANCCEKTSGEFTSYIYSDEEITARNEAF